jgi:hypothetical protein
VLDDRQFTEHFRLVHLGHPAVYFGPLLYLWSVQGWVRTTRVGAKVEKVPTAEISSNIGLCQRSDAVLI